MPQWVAEPYLKAYKGEPEALIKALSRGTAKNIAKVHRKKRRAFQIVKRVDALHAQGHTKQRGDIYTKLEKEFPPPSQRVGLKKFTRKRKNSSNPCRLLN